MVETRVWGLEALKHILRMRLALQGGIQLTRPVNQLIDMPQTNELLAANLTLTIRNKGNRCFANSVLRLWCWMGAHHDKPAEFGGPSTNLCLQILQQDDLTSFGPRSCSQSLPSWKIPRPSMTLLSSWFCCGNCGVKQVCKGVGSPILEGGGMILTPCHSLCGWQSRQVSSCWQTGRMKPMGNALEKMSTTLFSTLGAITYVPSQLTHFVPVPKLEDAAKAWDDFKPNPKIFWLGRQTGPKESQCAEWCHQAEQYALQNLHQPKQGRGWYLALELKSLLTTKPLSPWKKGDLAYWGQFCSILAADYGLQVASPRQSR